MAEILQTGMPTTGVVRENVCESESVAAPETIRISLPALRALLFEALDDGDVPGGSDWLFYHWNTSIANDQRERFVDIVCEKYQKRLRQLPAVAEREK